MNIFYEPYSEKKKLSGETSLWLGSCGSAFGEIIATQTENNLSKCKMLLKLKNVQRKCINIYDELFLP